MSRLGRFFHLGGWPAWTLCISVVAASAGSTALFADTASLRFRRDVTRMVFNDNVELLEDVRRQVGEVSDTLHRALERSADAPNASRAYVVVSIADHKLWYKQGDSVLYETRVATGSGRVLAREGGGTHWKFETPRGRLIIQSKDSAPSWVPPDWHFVEQSRKRGLGIVRMERGQSLRTSDGGEIVVLGNDVVKRGKDGRITPFAAKEGREIVAGGNIVIPPYGTNQRKYAGVLGAFRLNLGDGYALHGTDKPETIGRSVSHGCVRLRNEDITALYHMVPVGTAVYIY